MAKKKQQQAKFKVDTRLASILGENYRSSEDALKELVDNSWDADAENVWITLPEPMTDDSIIIKDDGCGMTKKELESEYLNIASDRITRKGERTLTKNRLVKGRKGIGKFAGLVVADLMNLETTARGTSTNILIDKPLLLKYRSDIEKFKFNIETKKTQKHVHGTTVRLDNLNTNLNFPISEKFKEKLVLEYGRVDDFTIYVNQEQLKANNIPGIRFAMDENLLHAGPVKLEFSVLERAVPKAQAGIVIRVNGKIVGNPTFFGLEEDVDLPNKLFRRLAGEIQADSLEPDVTADWGAIISNSKAFESVRNWVLPIIKEKVAGVFKEEFRRIKAKRKREINSRLAALPEYRRQFAEIQLEKILNKFYGESEERINAVITFVLDAMEKNEYWAVLQEIDKAKNSDIMTLSECLEKFGLVDMANISNQACNRLKLLDYLDALAENKKTLEANMHQALEKNTWVFGVRYSTMASNKTTAKIISEYTGKKYSGKRAKKRPDLVLFQNLYGKYLLIEFKKPSDAVGRDAEAQAKKYRDDITKSLGCPFDILIIGGKIDSKMSAHYEQQDTVFSTYNAIISNARTELNWLLQELNTSKERSV